MDLGDDRLGRVEEAEGRRDIGGEQLAPLDGALDRALGLLGQVVAGARTPARLPCEDDDPDVGVGLGGVEGRDERRDQRPVQGIELGRPVERQPDAPRRPRGQEDRASSAMRRGQRGLPRARPAHRRRARPSGEAMTGLRSTSTMSGSVVARAATARRCSSATAPRSTGGPPRTPSRSRAAAQVVEHRQRVVAVDRREADRHVVEHLGEHPAEPDHDGRPERRVAAKPDDELDTRDRPSAPRAGRARRGRGCGPRRADRPRRRARRRRPDQPEPHQAEIALVRQTDGVELERDGCPPEGSRRFDGGVGVAAPRSAAVTAEARGAQEVQALALARAPAGPAGRTPVRPVCRSSRPARPVGRPIRGQRRPRRPPRPVRQAAGARRAPSGRPRRSRVNASSAPRSSGAPSPCSSSTALVSGGGSPEVSDTYTGRMSRSVAGRLEQLGR